MRLLKITTPSVLLLAPLLVTIHAKSPVVTPTTFDDIIFSGQVSCFIKFYANWCGHCQAMAPAWQMLSDAYAVSEDTVIAEVDCAREEMKSLCDRFQVNAYPSLKYAQAGYEGELVDYEGEMTFEALEAFAKANVRAGCTAKQRDACDAEQLALLDKVLAMSDEERVAEYKKLAAPLNEEQAKLEALEERLEKLEEKVEEQEELVTGLKTSVGPKLRLFRSMTDVEPAADASHTATIDKDEV